MKWNKEGWGKGNVPEGNQDGKERREGNTGVFERRLFQAKEKSWHVQGTAKSRRSWSKWERERRSGRGGGIGEAW